MKFTHSWASLALLSTTSVLAQDTPTTTTSSSTEASTCTAFLINKLCDYPSPGPEFAVASSSEQHCWEYCNAHQPCNFGIFALGNPYTKTGTCWLYPGQFFDESLGTGGCSNPYLSVFAKPVCSGPSPTSTPTSTADAECAAATSSPSAMASICNYPPPDATCFSDCYASSGASNCLDICAKAESCAYAVFNPHSESMSPYSPGNCWVYPNGTFDESKATTCAGKPEQYVYENKCPKLKALVTPEAEASSTSAVAAKVSGAVAENATADEKVNGGGGAQNSGSMRVLSGAWVVVGVAVGVLFC